MKKLSILFGVGVSLLCNSLLAGPVLEIGEDSISADDLTPGGEAVLFYVSRERRNWATHVDRRAQFFFDDDQDGKIEFDFGRDIPLHSVWCVVDYETGEIDVNVPEGFPLKEMSAPQGGLAEDGGGAIRELIDGWGYLEVLLVRPGVGFWRISVGDGADSDDDEIRDGVSQVAFSNMQPVSESPQPPVYLATGDTLVVVNPRNLEFYFVLVSLEGE